MSDAHSDAAMTLVIVGAGFSGALTAVHLLRAAGGHPLRLLLIERRTRMARGLAYSTSDDNLLLNVPVGNMSALADEPNHFLDYCRAIDPSINAGSFVSRRIYGDYLERTLQQAERERPRTLTRLHGEAVAIRRGNSSRANDSFRLNGSHRFEIELADRSRVSADRVVLALGYSGSNRLDASVADHLVGDGWNPQTIAAIDGGRPVLIVGSGLTAIDTAFRLTSRNDDCRLLMVSRRGHLPRAHRTRPQPPPASAFPAYLQAIAPTARAHLRAIRAEVARRADGNWRDVINELRPYTPELWQRLPSAQRRQFLRHLAGYWDIHRHRLAPLAAQRLHAMLRRGQLQVVAGRIRSVQRQHDGVRVEIRERGGDLRIVDAAAAINCTGPNYDIDAATAPLIAQLRDDGYLRADALKMGIDVDDDSRVIGRDGRAVDGLHYIGPMLRARYWEATAVPELRVHARNLARRLIEGP